MSARVKPRIRRTYNVAGNCHEWTCSDQSDIMAYGWGDTAEAAYEAWLRMFARARRERMQ